MLLLEMSGSFHSSPTLENATITILLVPHFLFQEEFKHLLEETHLSQPLLVAARQCAKGEA
jgi:hypothetical protein